MSLRQWSSPHASRKYLMVCSKYMLSVLGVQYNVASPTERRYIGLSSTGMRCAALPSQRCSTAIC